MLKVRLRSIAKGNLIKQNKSFISIQVLFLESTVPFSYKILNRILLKICLLNFLLKSFKFICIILDFGWIIFNPMECQLLDFQTIILQKSFVIDISKMITSSLRFLSSLPNLLTYELLIFKPSIQMQCYFIQLV